MLDGGAPSAWDTPEWSNPFAALDSVGRVAGTKFARGAVPCALSAWRLGGTKLGRGPAGCGERA